MKIRAEHIKLAILDRLVTKALGDTPYNPKFQPSINWAQGGPLIEQFGIYLSPLPDKGIRAYQFDGREYRNITDCWDEDKTRLVVAMRCLVMSKFGEEFELPAELHS